MEIEGRVHNGVVVTETPLPEGARVTVRPHEGSATGPTHYELFREVIGQAAGLPEDMAKNHNHYLRGGPKQ